MSLRWQDAEPGDYAVIGNPIDHSKSPQIHQAAYQFHSLPLTYERFCVPLEEFSLALLHLTGLGYKGLNVTLPLKEAAFKWCKVVSPEAEAVGVLNTVNLLTKEGINTDIPAFISTLNQEGIPQGAPLMILGAGGSAQALILSLAKEGYTVSAWNRTKSRLDQLADASPFPFTVLDDPVPPPGVACIVNATSASLAGESLPLDWDSLSSDVLAYDLAYGKPLPFLESASDRGLKTRDGRQMLVEQGALAFEWWLGKLAPRSDMLKATYEHPGTHS